MEQSAPPGQPGHVVDIFPVTNERLREIIFFFRANFAALLAVTLPFAAAGTLSVQVFGEPVLFEGEQPGSVQWQSALLLVTLYPLALAVKTLAIHRLASQQPLAAGSLLVDGIRLWPALAMISMLGGLFVGSATMLSLGVGMELLQAVGLMQGPGASLLFLFALPGIYLYTRIGCATIIAATEGLGTLAALGAAWQRTREEHIVVFSTLLAVLSGLLLVLVLVFALIGVAGPEIPISAGADFFVRGLSEWLFCLVTIAFYRFWSLLPRAE